MEWVDALAEWVLFPLLILYGFTSWAKDNQKKTKRSQTNGYPAI